MRIERLIWGAIVFSTVIYGVLAYGAERQFTLQPFMAQFLRPIAVILYVIALAIYAASFWIGSALERSGRPVPALAVRMAMLEAVAIFGLLAAFVIHDWRMYLPAWALALIGFARVFPQASAEE